MAMFFDTPGLVESAMLDAFTDTVQPGGAALANMQTTGAICSAKTEWENAVDAIDIPIAVLDRDYSVRRANRRFAEWVGRGWDEILGRKCFELVKACDGPLPGCPHNQVLRTGTAAVALTDTRGGESASTVMCYPRKGTDSSVIGSVCLMEVCHRAPAVSARLIHVHKMAGLGRLAAEVAHELGAPLSTVAGYAELLLTEPLPDKAKDTVKIMKREMARAQSIVRQMRDPSKRRPPCRESVLLNEVVNAAVCLYAPAPLKQGITLQTELAEDMPTATGDFDQLLQVVLNLLSNACGAVRSRTGERTVTVFTRKAGDRVHMGVADTGPGIPRDVISRMFDAFFTTRGSEEGTGLGLTVCKTIVEAHQGTISVDSIEGEGSTFVVDLPAAPAPTSDSPDNAGNGHT